jgi:RHS repeat-associated protein
LNRLSTVTDASGGTTYAYDAVGNLQNFVYPNGVTHAYSYDTLNRLTQMGASASAAALSNYAYTLGAAGNRTSVAELSGRTVAYAYDSLYRLTTETVSADPNNNNGAASYTYDNVGNRKTLSTTIPPAGGNIYTYDADDRLGSDQYDPDGNTINSLGTANTYDFENHLVTHGGVTIVYDGDGNRVSETVGGVTTNYLVDAKNPTGYPQVVDELQSGTVTRTYSYGLERISEKQSISGTSTASFYGYDGHGSVRQLTNSTGAVTDTYDYDAFGNLINSTGSTPNNYLFAGEQYDPALGLYYNRARYLNPTTGRFWSMDTLAGNDDDPASLHRYLYARGNPINRIDPSGHQDAVSEVAAAADSETLDSMGAVQVIEIYQEVQTGLDVIKPALAAATIAVGLLEGPSIFEGHVGYEFGLNAATGGSYKDLSFSFDSTTNTKGDSSLKVEIGYGPDHFFVELGDEGYKGGGSHDFDVGTIKTPVGDFGVGIPVELEANGKGLAVSIATEFSFSPSFPEGFSDIISGETTTTDSSGHLTFKATSPKLQIEASYGEINDLF